MWFHTTVRSLAIAANIVCLLDSQAMAFTSPGLSAGQFFNPSPPLIPTAEQQAGAMPTPAIPEQAVAWQQYQQLARAYALQAQAQATGTAPLLPPMMAAHLAPPMPTLGTAAQTMPPMPGMSMPAGMPLPHPMAPMYAAQHQGYAAPPEQDDAAFLPPAEPPPQVGTTEGPADNRVAGPAVDVQGTMWITLKRLLETTNL